MTSGSPRTVSGRRTSGLGGTRVTRSVQRITNRAFSILVLPPSPLMGNRTSVSFMAGPSQSLCSLFTQPFSAVLGGCVTPVLVSEMEGASFGGGGSGKALILPFGTVSSFPLYCSGMQSRWPEPQGASCNYNVDTPRERARKSQRRQC